MTFTKNNPAQISNELVVVQNEHPVTSSRKIATLFKKRHADVLRDIKSLECSNDFRKRNFALSQFEQKMPSGGVKKQPEYIITKDGFTILAMGYTGKEAMQFKEAYIKAFNEMDTALRNQQNAAALHAATVQKTIGHDLAALPASAKSKLETGIRIKTLSKLLGIHITELCRHLDIGRTTVYRIFNLQGRNEGVTNQKITEINARLDVLEQNPELYHEYIKRNQKELTVTVQNAVPLHKVMCMLLEITDKAERMKLFASLNINS